MCEGMWNTMCQRILLHQYPIDEATRIDVQSILIKSLDNKVRRANMGSIWGRQDPGGPKVGPMNFAIWVISP